MRVTRLFLSAFLLLFVMLPEASGAPPGPHESNEGNRHE